MSEQAGSRVIVVCSDEARNGKTLVSRLLADHLLMTGHNPFVFDCDEPRGRIRRFYPDDSTLIDIEKTSGQITLFDTTWHGEDCPISVWGCNTLTGKLVNIFVD